MIAFAFHGFTHVPFLKDFRYLMRLDDDTCIKDFIPYDIFERMRQFNHTYAYKQIFKDPAPVVQGLNHFAEHFMAHRNLSWKNAKLRTLIKTLPDGGMYSFSTNLEVLDMWRYSSKENIEFMHAIVDSHNIYHKRWGDAPLRFLQAQMFYADDEVVKLCGFGYQHSSWAPSPMSKCNPNSTSSSLYDNMIFQFGQTFIN